MRDFPFSQCPTSLELHAYADGVSLRDSNRDPRVSTHLESCTHCQRVVHALSGVEFTKSQCPAPVLSHNESECGSDGANSGSPSAREFWISGAVFDSHDWTPEADPWVLLVLQQSYREYTRELTFEVVPALQRSVWDLPIGIELTEEDLGWGAGMVLFPEFRFFARREALRAHIGYTPDDVFVEVKDVVNKGRRRGLYPAGSDDGWSVGSQLALMSYLTKQLYALISAFQVDPPPVLVDDPKRSRSTASPAPARQPFEAGTSGGISVQYRDSAACVYMADRGASSVEREPSSILALIEILRSRLTRGDYTPVHSQVRTDVAEDLSFLASVPPLSATPTGEDVLRYLKRQTGRRISGPAVLLVVEAHLAYANTPQSGISLKAARGGLRS